MTPRATSFSREPRPAACRSGRGLIDVDVSITGPGAPAAISLIAPELDRKGLRGSGRSGQEVAVALSQGKLTETTIDESKIQALKVEPKTNALWIGFSVQFFVGALIAPDEPFGIATVEPLGQLCEWNDPFAMGRRRSRSSWARKQRKF